MLDCSAEKVVLASKSNGCRIWHGLLDVNIAGILRGMQVGKVLAKQAKVLAKVVIKTQSRALGVLPDGDVLLMLPASNRYGNTMVAMQIGMSGHSKSNVALLCTSMCPVISHSHEDPYSPAIVHDAGCCAN